MNQLIKKVKEEQRQDTLKDVLRVLVNLDDTIDKKQLVAYLVKIFNINL